MKKYELITEQTASALFDGLLRWDAFEIEIIEPSDGDRKQTVLIPYVMNDAVEYFLRMPECVIRGDWDYEAEVNKEWDVKYGTAKSYSFVREEDQKGLILRQESGNTITIWYQEIQRSADCYQYHLIGHKWRKEKGEEHLRRLVNLVCVLHDKYTYLGEEFCNEGEMWLCALAEFGPLRYYTPINQKIDDWYEESMAGCGAMIHLAELAGDEDMVKRVKSYENSLRTRGVTPRMIKSLAQRFLQKEHAGIYETLLQEITKASLQWPEREYEACPVFEQVKETRMEEQCTISNLRKEIENKYVKLGYTGAYPDMYLKGDREVQFVEEHPFTTLESDEYHFKIYGIHFRNGQCVEMIEEI